MDWIVGSSFRRGNSSVFGYVLRIMYDLDSVKLRNGMIASFRIVTFIHCLLIFSHGLSAVFV